MAGKNIDAVINNLIAIQNLVSKNLDRAHDWRDQSDLVEAQRVAALDQFREYFAHILRDESILQAIAAVLHAEGDGFEPVDAIERGRRERVDVLFFSAVGDVRDNTRVFDIANHLQRDGRR